MSGLVDFGFVEDHHEELLREAEERRLARHLREARTGMRNSGAGTRDEGVTVRWGLHADDEKVAELLELNGMPRWVAFEERFVVAERDGGIVAALRYRTESKRMLLGQLVVDPWAGERRLAMTLYGGALELARDLGVRDVLAGSPPWAVYPSDYPALAGYHRWGRGWRIRVSPLVEGSGVTSVGGWRRVVALFGFVAVPFFRAFEDKEGHDDSEGLARCGRGEESGRVSRLPQ